MKRELRGFLLGLGLAVLWIVLTAAVDDWYRGRYEFHNTGVNYYVLDTETGEMYLFTGGGKGEKTPKWYYAGGPQMAEK